MYFLSRPRAELYIREGNSEAGRERALVRIGGPEEGHRPGKEMESGQWPPLPRDPPAQGWKLSLGGRCLLAVPGALPLSPQLFYLLCLHTPPTSPTALSWLPDWERPQVLKERMLTPTWLPSQALVHLAGPLACPCLAGWASWGLLGKAQWTCEVNSEVLGCPQMRGHLATSLIMGHACWIPLGSVCIILDPSGVTSVTRPQRMAAFWPQVPWAGPGG